MLKIYLQEYTSLKSNIQVFTNYGCDRYLSHGIFKKERDKIMKKFENHTVWWDDEVGVVYIKSVGDLDEQAARFLVLEIEKIADEHGGQINLIGDLSQRKKITSKARKITVEIISHPIFNKIALVGASIFTRTVANFIISAAGNVKAQFFPTQEEALQWINDEKNN